MVKINVTYNDFYDDYFAYYNISNGIKKLARYKKKWQFQILVG